MRDELAIDNGWLNKADLVKVYYWLGRKDSAVWNKDNDKKLSNALLI